MDIFVIILCGRWCIDLALVMHCRCARLTCWQVAVTSTVFDGEAEQDGEVEQINLLFG